MKTYKNLYPKVCSAENIELAFKKARKNKTNLSCVIKFEENIEEELNKLRKELSSFTYTPLPLKRFIIRDPKLEQYMHLLLEIGLSIMLSAIYYSLFLIKHLFMTLMHLEKTKEYTKQLKDLINLKEK